MDVFSLSSSLLPPASVSSSTNSTPMCKEGHKVYTIQGVQVHFPFKAYPSQLAMMDRILKGLQKKENCLLESPTGSGKSVALLCACLAWQEKEKERIAKFVQEINEKATRNELCDDQFLNKMGVNASCMSPSQPCSSVQTSSVVSSPYFSSSEKNLSADARKSERDEIIINEGAEGDDDFKPAKRKRISKPSPKHSVGKELLNDLDMTPTASVSQLQTESPSSSSSSHYSTQSSKPERNPKDLILPKIYFGTRTHNQITQIVRELGRTAYKNAKMCILASRDRTCVHPGVSRSANKNEHCKELLDDPQGPQCVYYLSARDISQAALACSDIVPSPWNIEDLVTFGRESRACPYFGMRELMKDAYIIFCPYNYLINPLIRTTMEISLKGNVVVLDEAHNIEDSARDAASWSVTQHELLSARNDLEAYVSTAASPRTSYKKMASLFSGLSNWIARNSENLGFREFNRSEKVWSGLEFVAVLKDLQAGPENYHVLESYFCNILSNDKDEEEPVFYTLASSTVALLKEFQVVLQFLYRADLKYMADYKVAVVGTLEKYSRPEVSQDGCLSTKNPGGWTYTLNLWCLNPAVAFSDFKGSIHSLVVTSGTLSPMVSFQSELDMPFTVQLEANHVIDDSQVWVGALGSGPEGGLLNASFKFAETYAFQDEVGSVILQVCKVVPHGVLCFFPSYSMLSKLTQRWQLTGLWKSLEKYKIIVSEPRSLDRVNLDSIMAKFYHAIEESKNGGSMSGALFLAVFRGKVSEGLDFADDNARAVITVGIPFPSIMDTQVNLKREYNSQYSSDRSLLSGNQWYQIQAYRALNQALGRCIRHRNDWGALILIDDRFKNNSSYVNGLSKWIRKKLCRYNNFHSAFSSLKNFIDSKKSKEEFQRASDLKGITPSPLHAELLELFK